MRVGERIKSRRKALGMTQTDLANKLGYKDKSAISKIESGVVDVTRDKVIEFAKALKTTPIDLMGVEPDFILELEDDVKLLLELKSSLSPKSWERLKLYADCLQSEEKLEEESKND